MNKLKSAAVAAACTLLAASASATNDIPVTPYVKESNTLRIAMTLYAPFSYMDANGKHVGLSVELAQAAAKTLGVTLAIDVVPFTSLIPSLNAQRINIAWLNASVTEERLKQADFVAWIEDGIIVSTLPKNKDAFLHPMQLCGKNVAVQSGTMADFSADTLNKECQAENLGVFKKDIYPSQQDTVQAVITGRADAYLDDATSAGYYAQVSNGRLVVTGEVFHKKPIGHIIAKGDTATANMLAGVLQALIDNGTYANILDRYGMKANALQKPVVYTRAAQLAE